MSRILQSSNFDPLSINGFYGNVRHRTGFRNSSRNDDSNKKEQEEDDLAADDDFKTETMTLMNKKMISYLRIITIMMGVFIVLFLTSSGLYAGFSTCDTNPYQAEFNITESVISNSASSYYTLISKNLTVYPLWYFVIGFGFLCAIVVGIPFLIYISILMKYDETLTVSLSTTENVLYRKDGDFYFWITDAFIGIAVYGIVGQFIGVTEVFTLYCLTFSRFIASLLGGFFHEYFNVSLIKNLSDSNARDQSKTNNWWFLALAYSLSFGLMASILFTHMAYFDRSSNENTFQPKDGATISLLTLQWILVSLTLFFDLVKGLLMVFKYQKMNWKNNDIKIEDEIDKQNFFNFIKIFVIQLQYLTVIIFLLIQVLIY